MLKLLRTAFHAALQAGVSAVEDDDNEDFFEVVDTGAGQDERTNLIDAVVGKLEEILVDQEFERERLAFCQTHCDIFEETEENKLEYTAVFEKYSALIETTLEEKLRGTFPEFSVAWFADLLQEKENACEGDVFDMLQQLSDFGEFKDEMVSFRLKKEEEAEAAAQEGAEGGPKAAAFEVRRMRIYAEEQEDGDERPDLDMSSLQILPLAQEST